MSSREASHAGSWYSDSQRSLTRQLDQWLGQVPDKIEGVGSLPVSGARVIIAPYVPCYQLWLWDGTDSLDMRAMRILDLVLPMRTRRWTCPRRKYQHLFWTIILHCIVNASSSLDHRTTIISQLWPSPS